MSTWTDTPLILAGSGRKAVENRIFDLFKFSAPDALGQAREILADYSGEQVEALHKSELIRFDLNDQRLSIAAASIYADIAGNGWRKPEEARAFINCLLTNFIRNINGTHPAPTAVSTKHDLCGKRFSVEIQKKVLDAMVESGHLQKIRASLPDALATSYIPTLKAVHAINSEYLDQSLLKTRKPSLNEITLNKGNDDKVTLTARIYPEVHQYRDNLLKINRYIQNFDFMLNVKTALPSEIVTKACDGWIERENIIKTLLTDRRAYTTGCGYSYMTPLNTVLKRSFNLAGGEVLGGRFFGKGAGHYMGLKRETRKCDVLLNGETLPEPDFDSMQFAILYAMMGRPAPKNIYVYDKQTHPIQREVMKQLGVVVLNTTPKSFKGAVLGGLIEKAIDGDLPIEAVDWFNQNYATLKAKFYKRNEPISHMFGIGIVYKLMQIEAKILEKAMLTLIEAGIPFLPIHDSMKVRQKDAEFVIEVMTRSSLSVLGIHLSASL